MLCRGLFTPGHDGGASRDYDNVHGAAMRSNAGGYPLAISFAEVSRALQTVNVLNTLSSTRVS